ncbi:MAG: MFS transporter [Clostridia bacterium]|nr:MFS transporter [Clostridia bacterium]
MKTNQELGSLTNKRVFLDRKRASLLIYLCCALYSSAYVGRYSYAANLYYVMGDMSVTKDVAGMVSSFFFFSYASGQLLNSWLAKYYEPRRVMTVALSVSALCNLGIGLCPDVMIMRPVWLLNGIAQSMLWCCLLNMQSKYLSPEDVGRAIIWNSMTVAFGTVTCYGLTALFHHFGLSWRILFYVCCALLLAIAAIWWFGIGKIERDVRLGRVPQTEQSEEVTQAPAPSQPTPASRAKLFTRAFMPPFILACVAAATCSFIRDGVVTWLPTILIEDFGMDASLSTALTMILPMISLLGAMMVRRMQKYLRGNMFMEFLLFAVAALSLATILVLYSARLALVTLALFAIMYLMLMAISNITTSIIPFACRNRGNFGGVSALLDSCCYLGSMISTYGLGYVADQYGWMRVMVLIAVIAGVSIGICALAAVLAKRDAHTKDIL